MKKLLFLTITLFFINYSFCQEFDWAVSGGGWVDDLATSVYCDNNNNTYLTGRLASSTILNDSIEIGAGAYLIKFKNSGEIDWHVNFGTTYTNGVDVDVDEYGNVYLAGIYSHGFTIEGITLPGGLQFRIFLMKFNESGEFIWAKDYGSIIDIGKTYVNAIDIDDDNNIYLGGHFKDRMILGDSTYNVRGRESFDSDMLLIKVSPEGDVLSVKNPGSTSTEYIYDIAVNSDGIYLVGYWGGRKIEIDSFLYESPKNELGYIIKYNHNGEFEWANTLNAPLYSTSFSITLNDNQEAIVAGLWSEGNSLNQNRISVTKFDKEGKLLNNQLIKSTSYLSGYTSGIFGRKRWDVSSNGQSVYLTAGLSNSFEIGNLSFNSIGSQDIAIIKFNEVGFPQWLSAVHGEGDDEGITIASNNDTLYIAGVYSSSELNFDTLTIKNNSGNNDDDFYLAALIDTTSNKCPEIDSFYLSYPTTICNGDSVLISIENVYATYNNWFFNDDALNFKNEKQIYIKEEGTYKVEINKGTRCPVPDIELRVDSEENQSENTNIVIYSKPVAEIEGVEEICFGDTLILTTPLDPLYEYRWTLPNSFNNIDTTKNILEVEMSEDMDSAMFCVMVTNQQNACYSIDSFSVYVNPTPNISLYKNNNTIIAYCDNTDYFQWLYEGIELTEYANQKSIVADKIGNYYVYGSNDYGCENASDSIYISEIIKSEDIALYPNPANDFIYIDMIIPIEKVELINISGNIEKTYYNESILNLTELDNGIYILKIYSDQIVKAVRFIKN